ncbi:hypothetical protein PR048_031178 [Dryococelus australis]|uniref:Uncharacterized protein n=1 Tax=Dryococelus australis TaxID=614101 RepID=A0ABQ9G5N6_9NEOP|nr:hypothetical protein PR048_031178 [Dryococelus australis]
MVSSLQLGTPDYCDNRSSLVVLLIYRAQIHVRGWAQSSNHGTLSELTCFGVQLVVESFREKQAALGEGPLVFVRGSMNTEAYCNILVNEMLPTLWSFYVLDPCYFQDDNARCHNIFGANWIARQARPKSIAQLMEWLQEEWRRIPVDVLQTLVESMPDRDKIDVKHVYTEVDFAIGSQFIRHALYDAEPTADLQEKKKCEILPGAGPQARPVCRRDAARADVICVCVCVCACAMLSGQHAAYSLAGTPFSVKDILNLQEQHFAAAGLGGGVYLEDVLPPPHQQPPPAYPYLGDGYDCGGEYVEEALPPEAASGLLGVTSPHVQQLGHLCSPFLRPEPPPPAAPLHPGESAVSLQPPLAESLITRDVENSRNSKRVFIQLKPLVRTMFDPFWRRLAQSSPSTVTADNQRAADIGNFVHNNVESKLQPIVANQTQGPFLEPRAANKWMGSQKSNDTPLQFRLYVLDYSVAEFRALASHQGEPVDLCFTAFGVGPLVFVRGSMNTEDYCNILDSEMLPTLWRFYGMDPCYFQDDNARPDLNPIEHLWGELDRRVRARQARPKSIAQLMEWLQEEWRRIPVDILQTLVDSMPGGVTAVTAARDDLPFTTPLHSGAAPYLPCFILNDAQDTIVKFKDLQDSLHSLMYKYADIGSTLVVCCHSGRRRLDQRSPGGVKHRVDQWLRAAIFPVDEHALQQARLHACEIRPEEFASLETCRLVCIIVCTNMPISAAHWPSVVTGEGDDCSRRSRAPCGPMAKGNCELLPARVQHHLARVGRRITRAGKQASHWTLSLVRSNIREPQLGLLGHHTLLPIFDNSCGFSRQTLQNRHIANEVVPESPPLPLPHSRDFFTVKFLLGEHRSDRKGFDHPPSPGHNHHNFP